MKLLYASRDFTQHDARFVRAFVHGGFDVVYARLENDGVPYVAGGLPRGARWADWEAGGRPRPMQESVEELTPKFAALVARERPDVIHAGPVQSMGTIAALARAAPTVLVSWGSDLLVDAERDDWSRWATTVALQHCDAFMCDNTAVLDAARRFRSHRFPPYVCVPWGPEEPAAPVDSIRRSVARRALEWSDCRVVVSTRAWHAYYRVPQLVDAFADAAVRRPELRLLLVGDGEDAGAIDSRIRFHGIEQLVSRPGMLGTAELAEALDAADIYLSLVPSDGTSISLLEAMAHSLPTIVVRNPGNNEWVSHGVSGFLVDADDIAGFTETLVALASDPQASRTAGAAGFQIVKSRADWSANSRRIVQLYESTASQSSASG